MLSYACSFFYSLIIFLLIILLHSNRDNFLRKRCTCLPHFCYNFPGLKIQKLIDFMNVSLGNKNLSQVRLSKECLVGKIYVRNYLALNTTLAYNRRLKFNRMFLSYLVLSRTRITISSIFYIFFTKKLFISNVNVLHHK